MGAAVPPAGRQTSIFTLWSTPSCLLAAGGVGATEGSDVCVAADCRGERWWLFHQAEAASAIVTQLQLG